MPPEPLTKGLPPPDPRPVCPLSSTEFVEPPEKNSWVRHWSHTHYCRIRCVPYLALSVRTVCSRTAYTNICTNTTAEHGLNAFENYKKPIDTLTDKEWRRR